MIEIKIDASRKVLARKMEGDGPLNVEQLKVKLFFLFKVIFQEMIDNIP